LTNALGGGMRGGELMLLAGYTSHGKSIIADQMLDAAAREGYRCHLYMTEMTAIERGLRLLSRRSGVSFRRMRSRNLTQIHRDKIARELNDLPHGCTITADWSIDDVYRDVMRSRWDLVVIDLIHGFPYKDERELDFLSKMSLRMAKASTTAGGEGTAVVSVAHLNESQMAGTANAARPRPSLRSIKGSSSLKQDADFVTFVWLKDDDRGTPTTEGEVFVAKGRNTGVSAVEVILNPRRMAFEPVYKGGLIP
jgi:replicative DNA helicase